MSYIKFCIILLVYSAYSMASSLKDHPEFFGLYEGLTPFGEWVWHAEHTGQYEAYYSFLHVVIVPQGVRLEYRLDPGMERVFVPAHRIEIHPSEDRRSYDLILHDQDRGPSKSPIILRLTDRKNHPSDERMFHFEILDMPRSEYGKTIGSKVETYFDPATADYTGEYDFDEKMRLMELSLYKDEVFKGPEFESSWSYYDWMMKPKCVSYFDGP